MRSIFFLRCGLRNTQSITQRSVHNWVVEESRKSGTGEFNEDLKKYQVVVAKMINRDQNLSGAASVLFGSQNSTVNWYDQGIVALRSAYGMRIYPENSASSLFEVDPHQPYLTAPSLCMLYHKYLSAGYELPNRGGAKFNHNETTIDVDDAKADVALMVTNVNKIKVAKDRMQNSNILNNTDGDICYYDDEAGVLYSSSQDDSHLFALKISDDQRWGFSEIDLPSSVLSLKNIESNRDMFELAKNSYEQDVMIYARFISDFILRSDSKEKEIEEIKRTGFGVGALWEAEKGLKLEKDIISNFGVGSDVIGIFIDDVKREMERSLSKSGVSKVEASRVIDCFASRGKGSSKN